jgi:hypothetical protein
MTSKDKMRIFNREQNSSHPLFRYLEKMVGRKEADDAIARNYMHDPRVSPQREQDLLDFTFEAEDGKELRLADCVHEEQIERGLKRYFEEHIQKTSTPHFASLTDNLVSMPEELVSVFVINGLAGMFVWAKNINTMELANYSLEFQEAVSSLQAFPNDADPHSSKSKEFVHLMMKDDPGRSQFINIIFTIYEVYRHQFPYHPIWLTKRTEFELCCTDTSTDQATRWCHFVGKSTARKEGHWVLVLRFDANHFAKKYRPTILDAGNAFYFPAPDEAPVPSGLAADLKMQVQEPACEFIAEWPSLQGARVTSSARIESFSKEPITEIRKHHVATLKKQRFSGVQQVADWLTRVEEP